MTTTAASLQLQATANRERSMRSIIWYQFRRHHMAVVGAIILLLLVLGAFLAPLSPYDPENSSLRERDEPPSLLHPMGTDSLGRDMLTRLLYGGRISLTIGLLATTLGITIGTTIGALSGFYGGHTDNFLMRLTDLFLTLPRLFMLIIMTLLLRTLDLPGMDMLRANGGVGGIILILGILSWTGTARLVRGQFLGLKEKEFVEAARTLGISNTRIVFRHVLPNTATPVIVAATLLVAGTIISESGLSYLGFGVQQPTPTWGNMLNSAQDEMLKGHWWMAFFPGLMIFLTVISINYIGDGLRDALDPRKIQ
ncbi:MAG: ABC transporter permease [Caldilineaceae bacterium]|nr:ABC transporter permease [Caldilineaceae bacterium]MCB0125304.1 ABC transporter permease [Caldilineaceae bacterium]